MGRRKEEAEVIPRTFSASSLQVAELCLARYHAEYIERGANLQGTAANVGIVCHGTLEDFLRGVFIRKDMAWDEAIFWKLFNENYIKVFGPNKSTPEYDDAQQICSKWFNRKDRYEELAAVQILSLESKNSFPMKTSEGEIPFNYIMDRVDRIAPGEYRVVDYKSNRVPLTGAQLRQKLQARLYALMIQIKYKDATRIWVQFDFLRHEPVETLFTRDDNIVMFRELKARTQGIIDTPAKKVRETLNPDCGWCVRKASCKTLLGHIRVGGVLGKTPDELAVIHQQITDQAKAQKLLLDQIEMLLLEEAIRAEVLEFDTEGGSHVEVTLPQRRAVDTAKAGAVLQRLGLAGDYQRFSVTDIDNILKKKLATGPDAEELRKSIIKKAGEPSVKVSHKP